MTSGRQTIYTTLTDVIRKVRARLKNPPKSVEEYLSILTQQGLVATVADLEQFADLL